MSHTQSEPITKKDEYFQSLQSELKPTFQKLKLLPNDDLEKQQGLKLCCWNWLSWVGAVLQLIVVVAILAYVVYTVIIKIKN